MKQCGKCKETKSFEMFDKRLKRFKKSTTQKSSYHSSCKECRLFYQRKRRDRNNELNRLHYARSEKRRMDLKSTNLRNKFGISMDQYNKMFFDQNGCCSICSTHQQDLPKRLAVDHNHTTQEIRGLLCMKCNLAVGYLNESVESAENLIKYLNKKTEYSVKSNVIALQSKKVG